ncbi:Atxe2 family lasso peptide isopeptidase [Sphingopyxis witflariensis]|uniref:Atxe2 family lasso peptide isopeptidase n=1 Tax=Sphingopyxis witflariensis TaxID=173675 RepID=UPI001181C084|nr:Atxe2 family lasso peptide isopeptidase [Sphingopyxis witflariensis]
MVRRLAWAAAFLAAAPASGQTSPREIVEMTDFSALTPSPDGRWLLYRRERPSTITGRIDLAWYLVRSDGSEAPVRIGDSGAAGWDGTGTVEPGEAGWAADSRRFYLIARVDGAAGLWTGTPEGRTLAPFLTLDSDIERFALGVDGTVIYEIGPSRAEIDRAENDERDSGILVDARVDLAQSLYRGAMIAGRPASQRLSGYWFDREPLLAGRERRVMVRSTAGTADRPANVEEAKRLTPAEPSLSADLRSALTARSICIDEEPCRAPEGERLWTKVVIGDGRLALTTRDRRIRQRLFLWDAGAGDLRLLTSSEGVLTGGHDERTSCAVSIDALFCVAESAAIPPHLIRIALADGAQQILDRPNHPPDQPPLLTEAIDWQVGGSRASGWLVRPRFPGRLPLFVTYYRCVGYMRGGLGDEWPLRALAASGIATLCINSLPHPGTAPEARYALGLDVVRAAIADLDRRGMIDASRVGMGGLSFGSEVTMWTAIHSNLLRAASISSIQLEPAYYWYNAGAGRDMFRDNLRHYWNIGPPGSDPARWRLLSPALNVAKIGAPILLQMPEMEARQSPELIARLTAAHMGEAHVFPFASHLKTEPRQKLAVYQRNLDWFRYWLQGYVDPDPEKSAQYARWAKLGTEPLVQGSDAIQRSRSTNSSKRK